MRGCDAGMAVCESVRAGMFDERCPNELSLSNPIYQSGFPYRKNDQERGRRRQRRRSEVTEVSLSSAALFGVCSLLPWQP